MLRCVIVVGVLLQLTFRDAIPGVAVLYYALPRAILLVLAVTVSGICALQRKRVSSFVWGAAAVAIAGWWYATEWRTSPSTASAGGIRVMDWNVCRGYAGWDAIIRRIEAEQPDLVALGETEHPADELRAMWRRRLPQYDISFVGAGMMCLVRGTSSQSRVLQVDDYTQARELDATIGGVMYRCLLVDVYAHPLYDRQRALTVLAALADRSADVPLLILGDFNTPPESRHFSDLRRNHGNAFELAGSGYAATWPSLAPVLSLDQVWVNARIDVLECHHGRTGASDHRPVLLTIRPAQSLPLAAPVQDAAGGNRPRNPARRAAETATVRPPGT
ncbi:MAG: endonuclease/exonuclease/phosphatase family protein [Planctomycetaceae bacterium]